MKKTKICAIIIIALIILGTFNISKIWGLYEGRWDNDRRVQLEYGKTAIWVEDFFQRLNNVYCVAYNQTFKGTNSFEWIGEVKIKGNVATFSDGTIVEKEENNVLAAILTTNDLGRGTYIKGSTGQGLDRYNVPLGNNYLYGHTVSDYYNQHKLTDAQFGVYNYFNKWIDAVGAESHGFMKDPSDVISEMTIGKYVAADAEKLAAEHEFEVTICYLKNQNGTGYQNLIAVYPGEPRTETSTTEVTVTKEWRDGNNAEYKRPGSITVKLLANDQPTDKVLELNAQNNWNGKFTELPINDSNGNKIIYTVEEVKPEGYYSYIIGDASTGFIIRNTLLTKINVVKEWYDKDNLDEIRPSTITVELLADGLPTGRTLTISESDNWTGTFGNVSVYDLDGNKINYTIKEHQIEKYNEPVCIKAEDSNGNITFTLKNTYEPKYEGYTEIKGKVWIDKPDGKGNDINGKLDEKETGLGGIKVTLRDAQGNQFDSTSTVTTDDNGNYTIRVNYDNRYNVYKLYDDAEKVKEKLKTAYVEFEYDGLKYTTVASAKSGKNTSKAIENETMRGTIDKNLSIVTSTTNPNDKTKNNITAATKGVISFGEYTDTTKTKQTKVIKICNGNGTYTGTNPDGAWKDLITKKNTKCNHTNTGNVNMRHTIGEIDVDVTTIQNVNLGLFEREQPDVAIFSDLTKVQVTMNNQKYTYLYGVRSNDKNDVGLKVKFQNKDTYTYRRPVNPADIAYIQEETNKEAMSVLVTYEVKVANLSTTLPMTVHNITNYFDNRYTLNTTGWTVTPGEEFNKATSGELNISVEPQKESSAIELEYTVSVEAIRKLLNEEATLNNAVEIASYSTRYGAKTLYAEQRTGGRTNNPYGGYDYNSHPENAGIKINSKGILEAEKPEDDTDISPAFVLCKDSAKTLAGTIWEDSDENTEDEERLGNGHYEDTEKKVQNVKVELYNLDGKQALLYYEEDGTQKTKPAVAYTNGDGYYELKGMVTSEYFMKFTYGNDTTKPENATTMDGGTTTVNARNHKSTVIKDEMIKNLLSKDYKSFTEEDKKWHLTHEKGYSVAVDNMQERLQIGDLQYSNYSTPLNITALTKPFQIQVEFDIDGQSESDEFGNLKDVPKVLDKLDFGIAERPREDIFVEKTLTNFKVTLANGQVLTEGNPKNANMNYVKAMGFRQTIGKGSEARNAVEKQLLVEMDAELIQGAQLEAKYVVKITNNNELDYDYGNLGDYSFEEAIPEYDKYITKNSKANYYYYGDPTGLSEMQATVQFVDYMSKDLVLNEVDTKWSSIDADQLEINGLISSDVKKAITGYQILQKAEGEKITIQRKGIFEQELLANKILANNDKNVFDNNLEIISIDGKTGRTIQESTREGEQIEKSYQPGNYVPTSAGDETQQDDDKVRIIVTPPTGIIQYIIYVVTVLGGLTVIVLGIVFIKKKVLTK